MLDASFVSPRVCDGADIVPVIEMSDDAITNEGIWDRYVHVIRVIGEGDDGRVIVLHLGGRHFLDTCRFRGNLV